MSLFRRSWGAWAASGLRAAVPWLRPGSALVTAEVDDGPDGRPLTPLLRAELSERYPEIVRTVLVGGFLDGPSLDALLTVATAHGLIRARHRAINRGFAAVEDVVVQTYRRWLRLARETTLPDIEKHEIEFDGSLAESRLLLTYLAELETLDTVLDGRLPEARLTALPTAVVGVCSTDDHFTLGCLVASGLHADPSAQAAGGYLAEIVAHLAGGVTLREAVARPLARLQERSECTDLVSLMMAVVSGKSVTLSNRAPEECLVSGIQNALEANVGPSLSEQMEGGDRTARSIAGQLALAAGHDPFPLAAATLEELNSLADDLAWEMGRDGPPQDLSDAWLTRYPPN